MAAILLVVGLAALAVWQVHRRAQKLDLIARVEARTSSGDWEEIPRVDYNFFVAESGLGVGPYALRATDVHGNVLEDTGIAIMEETDQPGAGQFPRCE